MVRTDPGNLGRGCVIDANVIVRSFSCPTTADSSKERNREMLLYLAEILENPLIVAGRKPKPVGSQFVELLLNAADEAKDLRVCVDQRSPNHHQAAQTGTPHAAPFIHQNRRIPESFGDQNRLAFTEVEMERTANGSHLSGAGGLGDGDPISEGGFDGPRNRIIRAAFNNLTMNCGRNHHRVVDPAEQIEIRQQRQIVQWAAVGDDRTHRPLCLA